MDVDALFLDEDDGLNVVAPATISQLREAPSSETHAANSVTTLDGFREDTLKVRTMYECCILEMH